MRMNQRMRDNLGQSNPPDLARGEKLSKALSQLLAQGFTELSGAIVFTAARNIGENVKPRNFPDLTGFECFVNHIHVEDQLDRSVLNEIALLRQGIAFALEMETRLHSKFPRKPFKVIVASTAHGCSVRFHVNRPGEQWLTSDLDSYAQEAILVLET
jgi:hypothetical protein